MAKNNILQYSLKTFIVAYRYCISPLLGNCCRFYPSCSQYAEEAISSYGVNRGIWMAIKRILSCHPWHAGGYDPVPDSSKNLKLK